MPEEHRHYFFIELPEGNKQKSEVSPQIQTLCAEF